jgi:hypothetical protein
VVRLTLAAAWPVFRGQQDLPGWQLAFQRWAALGRAHAPVQVSQRQLHTRGGVPPAPQAQAVNAFAEASLVEHRGLAVLLPYLEERA